MCFDTHVGTHADKSRATFAAEAGTHEDARIRYADSACIDANVLKQVRPLRRLRFSFFMKRSLQRPM